MTRMIYYVLALLIAFASIRFGSANDYHILDVSTAYVDYKHYAVLNDHAIDPMLFPEFPKEGLTLGVDMGLIHNYGYWNIAVEALTTDSQYRNVGLEMWLGFHLTHYLDLGYYHHSAHLLDTPQPFLPMFQHEDALNVKIYLYRSNIEHNSLL
jgi:hypothetical protein